MSGRRVRPAGHPSAFDNEEIASLAPHRAATSQGHATGVVHLAVGAVQRDDGGVGADLFTVRQRLRPTGTARVVAFESTTVAARIHAIRVNRSMWHRLGIAVAARVMLRPDEPFLGHLGAVAFEKAQDATEYQVAHVIAADERVLLIVAVRIEMFDGSDGFEVANVATTVLYRFCLAPSNGYSGTSPAIQFPTRLPIVQSSRNRHGRHH